MTIPYFSENNFTLFLGDAIEILNDFEKEKFDLIYVDPPYLLSNNGITCSSIWIIPTSTALLAVTVISSTLCVA